MNTDRRIRGAHAEALRKHLEAHPCSITVGALGMGGETDALANDFLRIAKSAGCPVQGVYHGVGFTPFDGIHIKCSPRNTPTKTILGLQQILKEANLLFASGPDPSQKDGAIYIYVGHKP